MWGRSTVVTDARVAHDRAGESLFDRRPWYHATCSAMIINPTARKMLLTLHHKYHTWQQFGGHPDGEQAPILTAHREALEESGLSDLKFFPTPIDVDIHDAECPLGCSNKHIDVCFAATTTSLEARVSPESDALRWVTIEEAAEMDATDRVLLLGLLSFGLAGIQV
ncbi:NUDIX hydrolase [Nocardia goodfellowii]